MARALDGKSDTGRLGSLVCRSGRRSPKPLYEGTYGHFPALDRFYEVLTVSGGGILVRMSYIQTD